MKKRYTVDEVAKILEVSPCIIYRELRKGKLKAAKIGRKYIITGLDLEEYLGKERAHLLIDNMEK